MEMVRSRGTVHGSQPRSRSSSVASAVGRGSARHSTLPGHHANKSGGSSTELLGASNDKHRNKKKHTTGEADL